MKYLFKIKLQYIMISVSMIISYSCRTTQTIFDKQTKDLSILKADQQNSIKLGRGCEPVAFAANISTNEALEIAMENGATSLQIFREEPVLYNYNYDIRFWSCKAKDAPIKKIQLKNKNKLADVLFLDFSNDSQSENYQWISQTLPDAIDLKMKNNFKYTKTAGDHKPFEYEQEKSDAKANIEKLNFLNKTRNADIIIFGHYSVTDNSKKLNITSHVYYVKSDKIIAEVSEQTTTDIRLFQATDKLAENIVKNIYNYEFSGEE